MERTLAILAEKVGVRVLYIHLMIQINTFNFSNLDPVWSEAKIITPFSFSLSDTAAGDGVWL